VKRAFLWSAIATLAEKSPKKAKPKAEPARKRVLLIDEPECFLHPSTVRSAREAMYLLAELPEWQVLASTHSPIFVDVSKPHTTICRIERTDTGPAFTFCTDRATFSDEERDQLRMIRACNPFVSEFFFADHTVLVEGETEHAVLATLLEERGPAGKALHVVNCMGKANLPLFARILNHFGKPYTVIHDADSPRAKRGDKWITNAMWTMNERIYAEVQSRPSHLPQSRVFASIPDFERQYFGTEQEHDKPYAAIQRLKTAAPTAGDARDKLAALVERLLSFTEPSDYEDIDELAALVQEWATQVAAPPEQWVLA
jgi:putative ATP-dependent endonuclease of the OLD family